MRRQETIHSFLQFEKDKPVANHEEEIPKEDGAKEVEEVADDFEADLAGVVLVAR